MKDTYTWNEEGDEWLAIRSFLETAERLAKAGKVKVGGVVVDPNFAMPTLFWLNRLLGKDPEGDN